MNRAEVDWDRVQQVYDQMRSNVVFKFSGRGTIDEDKVRQVTLDTINRLEEEDELCPIEADEIGTVFKWEDGNNYTIIGYLPKLVSEDRKSHLPEILCRRNRGGTYFLFWPTGVERAQRVTAGNGSWEISWEDYEAQQIHEMEQAMALAALTDPIAQQAAIQTADDEELNAAIRDRLNPGETNLMGLKEERDDSPPKDHLLTTDWTVAGLESVPEYALFAEARRRKQG